VNIPLPAGCGDAEYLRAFREVVTRIGEKFEPEWILVSAGFDHHRRDPLGGMEVTEEGFRVMAALLVGLAEKHSDGRIGFLLEGGYDLTALQRSVFAVLQEMKGKRVLDLPGKEHGAAVGPLLRRVLELQEPYW
jgi:acetoin utilization deacetylase AcuC-like enzyme